MAGRCMDGAVGGASPVRRFPGMPRMAQAETAGDMDVRLVPFVGCPEELVSDVRWKPWRMASEESSGVSVAIDGWTEWPGRMV